MISNIKRPLFNERVMVMTVKKYSLKKSGNIHLSPHFTVKEFACHDGSDTDPNPDTVINGKKLIFNQDGTVTWVASPLS